MYVIHKLKPDRNFIPLLIPFSSFVGAALLGVIFGVEATFYFFTVFFWGYALYTFLIFLRTQNAGFVVAALFQTASGFLTFSMPSTIHNPANKTWIIFFIVLQLFLLVWLVALTATRRLKWRGRDILELAAVPVDEIGNGYTPRPLPAGKTEFSQRQIMEFAEFARRSLLAFAYVGKDKVAFVPVRTGREFGFVMGLNSNYLDETWVAFDFEGNVSVNISHTDYLDFTESLAFDQLCTSLGNLFVEFIEMYHRSEGVRILDRLDALRIPYYA